MYDITPILLLCEIFKTHIFETFIDKRYVGIYLKVTVRNMHNIFGTNLNEQLTKLTKLYPNDTILNLDTDFDREVILGMFVPRTIIYDIQHIFTIYVECPSNIKSWKSHIIILPNTISLIKGCYELIFMLNFNILAPPELFYRGINDTS